jgi:hypothetical protein
MVVSSLRQNYSEPDHQIHSRKATQVATQPVRVQIEMAKKIRPWIGMVLVLSFKTDFTVLTRQELPLMERGFELLLNQVVSEPLQI